ncbi:hypothetical protein [Persicirhabdus sediminis]|uniref:Uncharacterized protein n=1 Tax=Persicirhabdus sediminis TaxID=454144 RepID=A0A8J7MG78_9BACT|nr:hypothetical protein [Persicirhabdus sediminis]MBK1792462.1 hypothetical protein [Persicirhabdus sediminis]
MICKKEDFTHYSVGELAQVNTLAAGNQALPMPADADVPSSGNLPPLEPLMPMLSQLDIVRIPAVICELAEWLASK